MNVYIEQKYKFEVLLKARRIDDNAEDFVLVEEITEEIPQDPGPSAGDSIGDLTKKRLSTDSQVLLC